MRKGIFQKKNLLIAISIINLSYCSNFNKMKDKNEEETKLERATAAYVHTRQNNYDGNNITIIIFPIVILLSLSLSHSISPTSGLTTCTFCFLNTYPTLLEPLLLFFAVSRSLFFSVVVPLSLLRVLFFVVDDNLLPPSAPTRLSLLFKHYHNGYRLLFWSHIYYTKNYQN